MASEGGNELGLGPLTFILLLLPGESKEVRDLLVGLDLGLLLFLSFDLLEAEVAAAAALALGACLATRAIAVVFQGLGPEL